MKILLSSVRCLLINALMVVVAAAQVDAAGPGDYELLHLHLQSRMLISDDCSAGAILAILDGNIIYEEYLGSAHRGPGAAPINGDSRFPFYSVSKGFGSAVLLSLVSDGLIGLDDPVTKYLPHFTGLGPQGKFLREHLKVRHLASHSSGIPQDDSPPRRYEDRPMFEDVALVFEPGTGFLYSELAMRTLGQVLEVAGGKRYEVLLQERVLGPLGLNSIGYLNKGQDTVHVVHTCRGPDASSIAYSDEFAPKPYPGSGLYGSMRDIARYARLWLDGGRVGKKVIFKQELIDQAWNTQPEDREPDPDYGLLFWLFPQAGAKVISGAAHTICTILPEKNMLVVMGLNQRGGGAGWDFEAEKLNLSRVAHAIYERLER
jgi:CubicO group peptidase (beta-lactamase class C family)